MTRQTVSASDIDRLCARLHGMSDEYMAEFNARMYCERISDLSLPIFHAGYVKTALRVIDEIDTELKEKSNE